MLTVGTRSLLFGVHQFIYHPITVWLAWNRLYHQIPNLKETVAILVHDWGYWGCKTMDGPDGVRHPHTGGMIMLRLFGDSEMGLLVALHSRSYARKLGLPPSRLCWPDKLHLLFYPRRLYLFLARLSGELAEYRREAAAFTDKCPITATDEEWFDWVKEHLTNVALSAGSVS